MTLKIATGLFLLTATVCPQFASAQTCSTVFKSPLEVTGDRVRADVRALQSKYVGSIDFVNDVPVQFDGPNTGAKFIGKTNLVVISTHSLLHAQVDVLRSELLTAMSNNAISMPMKDGIDHLYTRIGNQLYDYDYRWGHGPNGQQPDGWRIFLFEKPYVAESRAMGTTRVLEPVILFSDTELQRLQAYLAAAKTDVVGTLGRFDFNGTVYNSGNLSQNVPPKGTGNNCTSWLMNAPVGSNAESLIKLLGPDSGFTSNIATNPGWLLGYLLTKASPERVPMTILWTKDPLATAVQNLKSQALQSWNFNAQ